MQEVNIGAPTTFYTTLARLPSSKWVRGGLSWPLKDPINTYLVFCVSGFSPHLTTLSFFTFVVLLATQRRFPYLQPSCFLVPPSLSLDLPLHLLPQRCRFRQLDLRRCYLRFVHHPRPHRSRSRFFSSTFSLLWTLPTRFSHYPLNPSQTAEAPMDGEGKIKG